MVCTLCTCGVILTLPHFPEDGGVITSPNPPEVGRCGHTDIKVVVVHSVTGHDLTAVFKSPDPLLPSAMHTQHSLVSSYKI